MLLGLSSLVYNLFCCKTRCLLSNQGCIIKIVDFHSSAHIAQSVGSYGTCLFAALTKHFVNGRNVLFELSTTLTDGFEFFLQNLIQELLYLHIAQTTTLIVCFHFVEVFVFGPIKSKVLRTAEGIEIRKHRVALNVSRIFHAQVSRVGIHDFTFFSTSLAVSER